jgi:hypothetical protein
LPETHLADGKLLLSKGSFFGTILIETRFSQVMFRHGKNIDGGIKEKQTLMKSVDNNKRTTHKTTTEKHSAKMEQSIPHVINLPRNAQIWKVQVVTVCVQQQSHIIRGCFNAISDGLWLELLR